MRGFPLIKAWAGDKEAGEQISTLDWKRRLTLPWLRKRMQLLSLSAKMLRLDMAHQHILGVAAFPAAKSFPLNDHSSVHGFVVWLKLTVDRLDLKPWGMWLLKCSHCSNHLTTPFLCQGLQSEIIHIFPLRLLAYSEMGVRFLRKLSVLKSKSYTFKPKLRFTLNRGAPSSHEYALQHYL